MTKLNMIKRMLEYADLTNDINARYISVCMKCKRDRVLKMYNYFCEHFCKVAQLEILARFCIAMLGLDSKQGTKLNEEVFNM